MAGILSKARSVERLVVVGGGMAGLRLIEELVAIAPGRYQVTLAGAEPQLAYNRILLSSYLAGDCTLRDVELRPSSWYAERGISVLCGDAVSALRPPERKVEFASGARLSYDRLVLATGSSAVRLALPGGGMAGVTTFRDLADVERLRAAEAGQRAVVIGGGLLGIEAAYGLARRGLAVTLLHIMPQLLERQLDGPAAAVLKSAVEKLGVDVVLEAQAAAIEGAERSERVLLADGRAYLADLVVLATGVRPNASLGVGQLDVNRGFLVDGRLQTSNSSIYAIGECAEHRGSCYGLVDPAYEQAHVLARHLAGFPAFYEGSLPATILKVSGIPVFSIGDFEGAGAEEVVFQDAAAGIYRKLVLREDRLCGAVLIGDTSDALWYRDLVRRQAPVTKVRPALAFGKAYAEAA